jgi:choline transport protein
MMDGGPCMMIYGWIAGTIFNYFLVYHLILNSTYYPVAGGIYHWSGIYASYKNCTISSYICGWSYLFGLISLTCLYAYFILYFI